MTSSLWLGGVKKNCKGGLLGNRLALVASGRAQSVRPSKEGSPRQATMPQMIETVPKVDPQRAGRRNKKHGIPHTLNFLGRDQRRPGKAQAACETVASARASMTSSLRGVGKSIFDNRSDIGEQTDSAWIISREIGLAWPRASAPRV